MNIKTIKNLCLKEASYYVSQSMLDKGDLAMSGCGALTTAIAYAHEISCGKALRQLRSLEKKGVVYSYKSGRHSIIRWWVVGLCDEIKQGKHPEFCVEK